MQPCALSCARRNPGQQVAVCTGWLTHAAPDCGIARRSARNSLHPGYETIALEGAECLYSDHFRHFGDI